jgi:ABC-2 type transport system ATP-binding protein
VIIVRDLTKLYGDFTAVRGVSFEVAPGEVLGLVGPNGAGKTTTLRCLAGIIAPSAGSVAIAGHDMRHDAIAAKRALAFIPDEPHLFEYLSVEEHLRFIARLYGVADVERRMPPLLDELELAGKRQALPGELSRGMRQKLAIACGLLHDPSALILDEPLTGLDPGGMRRMRATISARAATGAAVILSSHLLNLVEELCTKLLVVRQGQGVAYGTIDEIVAARPELAGRSLEDVFLALTGETTESGEADDSGAP